MNKIEIISELRAIKSELTHKYGVKKLGLFGSYANGRQNEDSDIDLLIFTDHKNYFKLIEMENYISGILKKKVDLGFYDGINSFIKKEIDKDIIYV